MTGAPAREVTLGPEPANAWGWLLARAPRLAKGIHDRPGSAAMFAKVLNAFELLARTRGVPAGEFDRRARDFDVEVDEPRRLIVIKLR